MLLEIADGVWTLEREIRLTAGLRMPARATFLRLAGDRIFVCSPLEIDDATAREVARIGEVAAIAAPNCVHHLFLKGAAARWPRACVFGPRELQRKAKGVSFEPLEAAAEVLGDDVAVRRIDGVPAVSEHVFFHAASRTLVVSDLVFNVRGPQRLSLRLFLRLFGAWDRFGQSRIWRLLAKDRAAASQSVHEVLRWDFDRLVMAHGDIVKSGARPRLEEALGWMLAAQGPPLLPRATQ